MPSNRRFLAHIDILGMRTMVRKDPELAWRVLSGLANVRDDLAKLHLSFIETAEQKMFAQSVFSVMFSDTIVLFTKSDSNRADYVETNIRKITGKREFKLEEARKAGYSDTEIAAYISKADAKTLERNWSRIVITIGIVYVIVMLGVVASTLMREAGSSTARDDA